MGRFAILINKERIALNATRQRKDWLPPISVIRKGNTQAEQGFEAMLTGKVVLAYHGTRGPYGRGLWLEGDGIVTINHDRDNLLGERVEHINEGVRA